MDIDINIIFVYERPPLTISCARRPRIVRTLEVPTQVLFRVISTDDSLCRRHSKCGCHYFRGGLHRRSGTTSYLQAMPVNYSCLIKVIANQSDRIISWDYNGNLGGCAGYINRLNSYYENKPVKQTGSYTGSTYDSSEITLSSVSTPRVLFDYARIYKRPDMNSEKVMPLKEGDQLRVYQENENWYEVGMNGPASGWVAKSWVETGH